MKLSEISANEMRSAIEDKLCAYFGVNTNELAEYIESLQDAEEDTSSEK